MEKEAAGIINACSNLVAQLDAHQTGGALFVCCLALVALAVVVLCLAARGSASRRDDRPRYDAPSEHGAAFARYRRMRSTSSRLMSSRRRS